MTAEEFLNYEYGRVLGNDKGLIHPAMLIKAMESYASLKVAEATKEMYPKEFVEWKDKVVTRNTNGRSPYYGKYLYWENYYTNETLFEYWKQNIRK